MTEPDTRRDARQRRRAKLLPALLITVLSLLATTVGSAPAVPAAVSRSARSSPVVAVSKVKPKTHRHKTQQHKTQRPKTHRPKVRRSRFTRARRAIVTHTHRHRHVHWHRHRHAHGRWHKHRHVHWHTHRHSHRTHNLRKHSHHGAQHRASLHRHKHHVARAPRGPRGIARSMLHRFGWGRRQFAPLNKLWTKESGWRTRAMNRSSGAYGIPQSLPGGKMASAGRDWRTNPRTQIRWGLRYIKARWGSPSRAWAHSRRTNWY